MHIREARGSLSRRVATATKRSSSDVCPPNANREPISDDDLIRGFVLLLGLEAASLGPSLSARTAYEAFPASPKSWPTRPGHHGPNPHPPLVFLAPPERQQTRYLLHSLQALESPHWLVRNSRVHGDDPVDRVDPPRIPSEIEAYYQPDEVEKVVKSSGRSTPHNLRDAAMVMVLHESGEVVRDEGRGLGPAGLDDSGERTTNPAAFFASPVIPWLPDTCRVVQ